MEMVGDVSEIPKEVIFEWNINEFFSLSIEKDIQYFSPTFYYAGESWEIRIFCNGHLEYASEDWIGLHLVRTSTGAPVTVNFSLALKSVDGKSTSDMNFTRTFDSKCSSKGIPNFIEREELMGKKSDLAPSDKLTVVCILKSSEPHSLARSLNKRHQDVCDNLCEIYGYGKRADFKLICNDGQIFAHRLILETRSPVFAAMFSHDTEENQTGEVCMDDIDRSTMDNLFQYIYTGDMDNIFTDTVFSLYAAADKCDLKDMKDMCLDFIIGNLCVEWVCDVIKFAEQYEEQEVNRRAREYFKENADKILESENWKIFAKENHDLGVELLGSLVKELLPKRKSTKE